VTVADTVPYPWPYDGALRADRFVLLICGAQRALTADCEDATAVLEALDDLADVVRHAGGTVIWVRHGATASGAPGRPSALPRRGDDGWALVRTPLADDEVVDAAGWDGTYGSTLEHDLRRRRATHLALGGIASELTVDSTVRSLNDRGFECLVLTDGCAPIDADLGARAHASLTMSGGIFGALGTAGALTHALVNATSRTGSSR